MIVMANRFKSLFQNKVNIYHHFQNLRDNIYRTISLGSIRGVSFQNGSWHPLWSWHNRRGLTCTDKQLHEHVNHSRMHVRTQTGKVIMHAWFCQYSFMNNLRIISAASKSWIFSLPTSLFFLVSCPYLWSGRQDLLYISAWLRGEWTSEKRSLLCKRNRGSL